MDDGSFLHPSSIVYDLEQDLSAEARAPPSYLANFANLMKTIGAPSLRIDLAPQVLYGL
jgi:hypothetical protein